MDELQCPDVTGKSDPAGLLTVGSAAVLAVLAASCCVLPIGLSIIGIGGAWLAVLGPLVAYREVVLVGVGLVVAWSWWRLWRSRCTMRRNRLGITVSSIASIAFVAALSAPLWEAQLAQSMWHYLITSR